MDANELFGWSKASWEYFDQWGILLGSIASVLSILAFLLGVIALFNRDKVRQYFTKNRFPHVQDTVDDATHWQGMLFTVSHDQTPKWVINTWRPDAISLLASKQSQRAAEAIVAYAEKQGISVFDPIYLNDPDSPAEAKRESKHLLQRMREAGAKSIAVDITGGKTPMSLGAFMAAEEEVVTSVYVSVQFNEGLKKPDMRTANLTTISGPE